MAETPHTRRAQAITWKVWEDNSCYDPACLQSIWCRITDDDGQPTLNMNVRFRSNDAYKAAFMNIFALVQLQQQIAARVGRTTGRRVRLGRYCHMADSYHIYGSNLAEFEARFLGALERRTFAQRTMRYEDVREIDGSGPAGNPRKGPPHGPLNPRPTLAASTRLTPSPAARRLFAGPRSQTQHPCPLSSPRGSST